MTSAMTLTTRSRLLRRHRAAADSGWTLIELIVVLAMIMILASVAMVQYRNSIVAAREAVLKSNLFHMRDAIDQYYADKGRYPESLETLVSESYLRSIPNDPFTNMNNWTTTQAESQPGASTTSPGIYDVKSTSDGMALDGSRYSDW
jgi:general secretion pathway protein G